MGIIRNKTTNVKSSDIAKRPGIICARSTEQGSHRSKTQNREEEHPFMSKWHSAIENLQWTKRLWCHLGPRGFKAGTSNHQNVVQGSTLTKQKELRQWYYCVRADELLECKEE